tara:strand:- start:3275 stop:3838 length:564 start_codon:yes stop_codon:yes gene_type:complete
MSIPDIILTCVSSHLGIDNVVSATSVRGKRGGAAEVLGYAVAKYKEYENYWDVFVWESVKEFQYANRPKCDHKLQVGKDGTLYKKKRAGRKKAVVIKGHVGFRMNVADLILMDKVCYKRSSFIREACKRSTYLNHLRFVHQDWKLHTRPIGNEEWGLFTCDGVMITRGKDEVEMLRDQIPYRDLMTR